MPTPLQAQYDDLSATFDSGLTYADDPVPTSNPKAKHMARLKLNTSRMNADQLIDLADIVVPKVDPEPPETPPVANMSVKAASLKAKRDIAHTANEAYKAARAALPGLLAARNAAADDLRLEHNVMGSALESESRGDPVQLSKTGYQLADDTAPATTPPGMITDVVLTAGDLTGALDVSFDPDELAYTYKVELTSTDPVNGPWTLVGTPTEAFLRITGLTSGQRVWVRVCGSGSKGDGPWSDPATKIVP